MMDKAACTPQQRRAGNKTRAVEQRGGPAGPSGIYGAGARGALSRGHARTDLNASAAPSAPEDPPARGETLGEPPTISAPRENRGVNGNTRHQETPVTRKHLLRRGVIGGNGGKRGDTPLLPQ